MSTLWCKEICTLPPTVGKRNSRGFCPSDLQASMPKLKASDYDYIIFDMPPVTQTSMTPRWPDSWTWSWLVD